MTDKIEQLFKFISNNREYNKALQERYYRSIILPYKDEKEKIISLLYHIANTQSQPKIDKLSEFYKSIITEENSLKSFKEFVLNINPNGKSNFESVYKGMLNQKGWGPKTSALISKSIFHLHNGQYSEDLKIWNDVPKLIDENDSFYLPVDAVIIAIFTKLDNSIKWDFDKINKTLETKYKGQQIEVWDDLWFWGFITQNGSGENRVFEWNENKYWVLKESDKEKIKIEEIKNKCQEFLKIFK
ncbi:hypothetical protein FNW25_09585 [Flavobacterium franklandianum]|uniref:Uncharacterized protein n=1 Tax=Flavobacterium franklandianum TaxID=2594430 RepID=A0A553CM10_9FLAO|nr:hypothetical protein [Flavobacterium franklandianum]TRX21613.1 hypothetical protein FNW17_06955 [Flavobacterium franklandianum]TRX25218.1 hypothetical protein FNW25_09585 [Flavobacterium franklandianum]